MPTILPGISLNRGFLHAINAACGPPYPSGVPSRWLLPTTMSTPYSPGALIRVRDNKSVAHTTNVYDINDYRVGGLCEINNNEIHPPVFRGTIVVYGVYQLYSVYQLSSKLVF